MIWRSNSGNFGVHPNKWRALLKSLTSTGGSPGRRAHIFVFTGRPVTFSVVITTSATEKPRPLPILNEWPRHEGGHRAIILGAHEDRGHERKARQPLCQIGW